MNKLKYGVYPQDGGRIVKSTLITLSFMNMMFMFMHEFDAFYQGEWKMFKFLRTYHEKAQYLFFLYLHIPFILVYLCYLLAVINFSSLYLWLVINAVSILHLIIHLIAIKWNSNVFKSVHSFVFIGGAALAGGVNLLLSVHYI